MSKKKAAVRRGHNLPSAQAGEELPRPIVPREIRLAGERLFTPPPGTRDTQLPAVFRAHAFIAGQYFRALPLGFVQLLEREFADLPRQSDWMLERAASEICGDFAQLVGFWNEQPIEYPLLRPNYNLNVTPEEAAATGWESTSAAYLRQVQRIYEERVGWMNSVARGYAGWLRTNPLYLGEERRLLAPHADMLGQRYLGIANLPLARPPTFSDRGAIDAERWSSFAASVAEFCRRWRLQGLAAPGLPIPLRPLLAGAVPASILTTLIETGGFFHLPDTFPIPSRDQMREMLDDAIHPHTPPEHLTDWSRLVSARNLSKNAIARFARVFELQHYWIALYGRYSAFLKRSQSRLVKTSAEFLGVSENTLKADLRLIRNRCGASWLSVER